MYFGYLEHGPGQLSAIYLKKRRDGPKLCPHHKQSRAVILTTSQRPKLQNIQYIKYKYKLGQKRREILLFSCTNSVWRQGLQDGQDFYFPAPTQPVNQSKNQVKTFIFPHQLSLETELKRWAGLLFPAPTQPGNKANMMRNRH